MTAAQSNPCTHGEWVKRGSVKIRVLGLQCTCQHALETFVKANRYIDRLTGEWAKEFPPEILRAFR